MHVFAPVTSKLVVIGALAVGLWAVGCAGNLDPGLVPTGQGGTGAPSGNAGSTGTGGAPCDAVTMTLANTAKCGMATACHGGAAPQGVDLVSPGLIARLLDKKPPAASPSCATSAMPYLVKNSNPATGLLIDKLKDPPFVQPCGSVMPFAGIGGALTPSELACVTDWATAVTTGRITQ